MPLPCHQPEYTMNAIEPLKLTLPTLGHLVEGGFFHGVLLIDGKLYGEATGPKADCFVENLPWMKTYKDVPGATSDWDGLVNTQAMAKAGSPLAEAAQACRSGGFDDWYVAARGGLLLQYGIKKLLPEAEAFEERLHWSSTQFSRYYAFHQHFDLGSTNTFDKSWSGGAARFVRRFLLESLIA